MELVVLGACGTYPVPGGACSGYLLTHEGFSLWVDAGNGTLAHLQEHVPLQDVDAVFLSHTHPDHCVDLYPFFYALSFQPRRSRTVPVYGPAHARETLGRLLSDHSWEEFGRVLTWHALAAGASTEIGPFRVRIFDSVHSSENLTVRAEAGGRVVCYSGDTGPNAWLSQAAQGSDLFLCEASWLDHDTTMDEPIHLRAREAGEAAHRAGAGRLVLTHIWPSNDEEVSRAQAAEAFSGEIDLAGTGRRWRIS